MKALKPRTPARIPAEEALRISAHQAPTLPPAVLPSVPSASPAAASDDRSTTLNLRLRTRTVAALARHARETGQTQKQVVCRALADAGVEIAPEDLEDRTPRRKGV